MKNGSVEVMARREDWTLGVSLFMRHRTEGMGICMAQPVEFKQEPEAVVCEPLIRLEVQEAQQLMDELWQCGLRPTEGTGSAGSLRSTEKHLADMRTIVMKKLEIKTEEVLK